MGKTSRLQRSMKEKVKEKEKPEVETRGRKDDTKTTIRLRREFIKQLRVYCALKGVTQGEVIEEACTALFNKDKNFKEKIEPYI